MAINNALTIQVGKTDMLEVLLLLQQISFTLGGHLFSFELSTPLSLLMTRRSTAKVNGQYSSFSPEQRKMNSSDLKQDLDEALSHIRN